MTALTLIVEDENSILTYKKFLKNKNYKVNKEFVLDSKRNKISDDLVILDIKNPKRILDLENYFFLENCSLIIISPVNESFISIPDNLKEINLFYLIKPVDLKKLQKILFDCSEKIRKIDYLKSKEKILSKSVDDSPLKVAIYDFNGFLVYANKPYIKFYNLKNIYNNSFKELISDVEFSDIKYNLNMKRIYFLDRKIKKRWIKSFYYFTQDTEYIIDMSIDQTDDKHNFEILKKSAHFFEHSSEGVLITDNKTKIITTNSSFCNITGYTKDEAIGKSVNILKSGIHNKDFYENMWQSLEHHNKWQGEIWNKRKNGEVYPEWLSITKFKDTKSEEIHYMAIFSDISSLKEADKKLHFYANYDHLTGLLNRVQFENILNQSISSAIRNNKKFALLFVDLDYFKDVNDSSGHDIGDLVLKEVASRLLTSLRKEDIVARIGGDEFNIIIDDISEDSDVILLARKLNESIKKPFHIENKTFYLSLSIGISIFPSHGLNSKELLKNADSAMYQVKTNGRSGVLLYDKKFTEKLMKKVSLHSDLKRAIKNEEFEVYYQPVIDMKTKKVIGAEALIRWNHIQRGFVSPEEFIPIAMHHGLIRDIGKLVLKMVCESLSLFLNKFGKNFILAFNVSSKEFAHKDFVFELLEVLNDFNISAKNLEIEITETYIMQNHDLAIEKMNSLKQEGFHIAIDDFGTGYSSLSYLKKFPIDKIKIDKSFILDVTNNKDDYDMVNAIINIAKIFDLEVQAEGIETKEQLKILEKLKVDIAQGYFYSKPISLKEVLDKQWDFTDANNKKY